MSCMTDNEDGYAMRDQSYTDYVKHDEDHNKMMPFKPSPGAACVMHDEWQYSLLRMAISNTGYVSS